jgi:hypothetical protein
MIYRITAYNLKTIITQIIPKMYEGKVSLSLTHTHPHARACAHTHMRMHSCTHAHTHTRAHMHTERERELAPDNHAMTFNTSSITVLVSVQHVLTYKALQIV